MEVISLLDLLTDELNRASQLPLSGGKAAVDRVRMLDMVEQIKAAIPNDIREAERFRREHQRMIMEANREADVIIDEAEAQAKKILSEHEIIRRATADAKAMLAQATEQSRQVRGAANDYASELLGNMDLFLKGHVEMLEQNRQALKKMIK